MLSTVESRDRKKSDKKASSGYYKFTFEEEFSDSGEDSRSIDLSPQDLVARVLRETELDTDAITASDQAIPEPDFSFDFLQELEDGNTEVFHQNRPKTISVSSASNNNHVVQELPEQSDPEIRAGTPDSLHSPLDHPDSGYIEFIHARPGSSGYSDTTRSHSEGFEDDFRVSSPDCDHESGSVSSGEHGEPSKNKSNSKNKTALPQVRFRRFKSDFEKLEEDRYIDDEIHKHVANFDSREKEVELQDLKGRGKMAEEQHSSLKASSDKAYLPMPLEMALDQEEEAMLDPERGHPDADDTNPIFVDQTTLTDRYQKRRKKILIVVAVLAVFFGLGGLSAITYFLVKFLIIAEL